MKVLGQITEIVNKDINSKYPFGANIQNKTESLIGTPVVRELYADVLMNLYNILKVTKVIPTNTEDNDQTQYQLVEALRKLTSDYDKVRTLNMVSGIFAVDIDFSIVQDGLIVFAVANSGYESAQIQGLDGVPRNFISSGFSNGEMILLHITSSLVTAYSFMNKSISDIVYTNFGSPLQYNYSNALDFKVDGVVLKGNLSRIDLEYEIRGQQNDIALIVDEVFKIESGYVFSVSKSSVSSYLKIFFKPNSGAIIELQQQSQIDVLSNANRPLILCDGIHLYVSNGSGSQTQLNVIDKYLINLPISKIVLSSRNSLDSEFLKTHNSCVKDGYIYQFMNGVFSRYGISDGTNTLIYVVDNVNGRIFNLANTIYLSTGEVARKLV